MNNDLFLSIIELIISLLVESVIISMIFQFISNKSLEKQAQHLENELANIEKQNKFDFEQLQTEIRQARTDIISQIKEERKQ